MAAPPTDSFERLEEAFRLQEGSDRRRMLVIVNPYATTVSDRLRNLVVHALSSRYEVTAVDTQRQGHAMDLVREAAHEGFEVVVAFGGDGTINEAANGLVGTDVPLTALPGGATNVFCRLLGVPNDIVDATEHLLRIADEWRPRRVDLGQVNGRHFTFACGYGLDAAVVKWVDLHPARKHRFGEWYFTWSALRTYFRDYAVRPQHLEVRVGGRTLDGITAIVQNGDPFTFFGRRPLHLADGAELDSGTLAGVVARRCAPHDIPTLAWRIFSTRARVTDHRQVSEIGAVTELRAVSVDGTPIPLEVDGDWIGDVPEAVYGITPRALTVVA